MSQNQSSLPPSLSANPAAQPPHLRHSAFLPTPTHHSDTDPTEPLAADREPVRLLVVGSAQGIEAIVQTLHLRGFAHISEWSRAMPHSSGQLMRVLTRWVRGL